MTKQQLCELLAGVPDDAPVRLLDTMSPLPRDVEVTLDFANSKVIAGRVYLARGVRIGLLSGETERQAR